MTKQTAIRWVLALAILPPQVAADRLEDCGLAESDQFVGVLLFEADGKTAPSVYVHGLSGERRDMWIVSPHGLQETDYAVDGRLGYTALEAAFASLVGLPPEEFKRWPVEPHCEFAAHVESGRPDWTGHVFKLDPGDLGIDRTVWEQWDFQTNGLTTFRLESLPHYAGVTWTRRGGPDEAFDPRSESAATEAPDEGTLAARTGDENHYLSVATSPAPGSDFDTREAGYYGIGWHTESHHDAGMAAVDACEAQGGEHCSFNAAGTSLRGGCVGLATASWRDRGMDAQRAYVVTSSSFRDLIARDLRSGCEAEIFAGKPDGTVAEHACDVVTVMCAGDALPANAAPDP